jgi:hypothetical protein
MPSRHFYSRVLLLMADEWMKYAQMNHPQIKILSEFQKQTLATNQPAQCSTGSPQSREPELVEINTHLTESFTKGPT